MLVTGQVGELVVRQDLCLHNYLLPPAVGRAVLMMWMMKPKVSSAQATEPANATTRGWSVPVESSSGTCQKNQTVDPATYNTMAVRSRVSFVACMGCPCRAGRQKVCLPLGSRI